MEEYKLLNKIENYDLPTVQELAKAMNELAQMENRRKYLEDLIRTNNKLKEHVWRDKSGFAIAIADLTDEHLKNLISYWKRRYNDDVPGNIRREMNRRGIDMNDFRKAAFLIEPPEPR